MTTPRCLLLRRWWGVLASLCAAVGLSQASNEELLIPSLVPVEPARWVMGDGALAKPAHPVEITRPFAVGRYEVTNEEYRRALQWAMNHHHVVVDSTFVLDVASRRRLLEIDGPYNEFVYHRGRFNLRPPQVGCLESEYGAGYDPALHPVSGVTWYGAAAFCNWLSEAEGLEPLYDLSRGFACRGGDAYRADCYRLPTEAEWELAARGTDQREFPWPAGTFASKKTYRLPAHLA